ncbi:DUF1311 domain-containing protein [Acidithiobacillus sp. CV18-2]|uniref:DUF1311 domain-containing protein n=1 Tax=Igneacidithiobacillus copahuensis TaxID=2724909 RepID=A0AAE2YQU7_9PROT|nr:lysozyme inhibitor LprI family protein [Igneacidithiobacillus copahuensis]MBU2755410.1 DUF1311 domain-containing protein [Acidithiobacillus sp. CV18-3]MBU2758549.1 DUF1311 domain-containing protein [Acidithiobacillus sp. BN09-2]MBU2776510.1 DUF1311 domain-containing protein [Acidithiobacillus sp. CV18-2]MBU2797886.1 DUF1311 domain-containing protein [Acidithiobacillus sp. VAN18-2]MBU2800598.1 DUF1311 domain-containing protein [Acidithiobacillus sp. VAN18-4]UTV80673.1 lysozyme inhibitor Lpr
MKRMGLVFWLLALFPPVLQAAPAPVTAETLAGKSSSPGVGPDTYTLVLKQGGKTVVSRKDDTEGGHVPEVQTFPAKYCGVPVQVVVLWAEHNNAEWGGDLYDFLIFNPQNWGLVDEFQQSDTINKESGKWNFHADADHTIAILRAGHYYGPRCRIFDLYTKPLPAKGPSFDCKTASNRAEEMVCKHPELAALDRAYGARLRDRLLKVPAAERQDAANGYYWDMGIRDNSAMSVKDLAAAYRDALGTDSAQYFAEKQPAQSAHAACEKAHTPSEKTVCANPQLKTLDEQLAQAYHQAFIRTQPNSPERRELIQAQRNWLKTRDTCKADVPCLEQAYRNRIQRLSDHAR